MKSSILFSRTVAAVKYVRVTEIEISGPLCTQCGVPGGMYTATPRRQGVRGQLRWHGLDPPMGAIPVPVDLVPAGRLALEATDADVLHPLTCIRRLCSMSKWTGVTEFGEETKMNATRLRILPCLPTIPGSS